MKLRTNGKYSRIQYCCECGERVKPLMIIGNEPDDWIWPDCLECGDVICPDCRCEHNDELYCPVCYGGIRLNNARSRI